MRPEKFWKNHRRKTTSDAFLNACENAGAAATENDMRVQNERQEEDSLLLSYNARKALPIYADCLAFHRDNDSRSASLPFSVCPF
jgi:hypothetical protein